MDGRDFIKASIGYLKDWRQDGEEVVIENGQRKGKRMVEKIPIPAVVGHFVMNLPATATEFLGMII
jgi:hypothetical protein